MKKKWIFAFLVCALFALVAAVVAVNIIEYETSPHILTKRDLQRAASEPGQASRAFASIEERIDSGVCGRREAGFLIAYYPIRNYEKRHIGCLVKLAQAGEELSIKKLHNVAVRGGASGQDLSILEWIRSRKLPNESLWQCWQRTLTKLEATSAGAWEFRATQSQ